MKSKLGISVGLLVAGTYFLGFFSGYLALVVLVGYILLFETDEWLRKNAVKAIALTLFFSLVTAFISFIPNIVSLIDDIFVIFDKSFSVATLTRITTLLTTIVSFVEKILMLVLGFKAIKMGTVKIGIIDNLINEHMK